MTEKRVSVRLAAVGGRQVRAELEGVGAAGAKGFGRLSREMELANARLAGFGRKAGLAAAAVASAMVTAGAAMTRATLQAAQEVGYLAQVIVFALAALAVALFLFNLRRAGEQACRAAERLDAMERDDADYRKMLEAAARRPRVRDTLADRLRDGRF